MNKIKTYLIYTTWIFASLFSLAGIGNVVFAWGEEAWFFNQKTDVLPAVPQTPDAEYTDLSQDTEDWWVNSLLDTIRTAINWALWLLALIALIILIIAWFRMLFNSGDDGKVKDWYKTIKNVAIALVFIGISRLVISFIFRAIGQFTGT